MAASMSAKTRLSPNKDVPVGEYMKMFQRIFMKRGSRNILKLLQPLDEINWKLTPKAWAVADFSICQHNNPHQVKLIVHQVRKKNINNVYIRCGIAPQLTPKAWAVADFSVEIAEMLVVDPRGILCHVKICAALQLEDSQDCTIHTNMPT